MSREVTTVIGLLSLLILALGGASVVHMFQECWDEHVSLMVLLLYLSTEWVVLRLSRPPSNDFYFLSMCSDVATGLFIPSMISGVQYLFMKQRSVEFEGTDLWIPRFWSMSYDFYLGWLEAVRASVWPMSWDVAAIAQFLFHVFVKVVRTVASLWVTIGAVKICVPVVIAYDLAAIIGMMVTRRGWLPVPLWLRAWPVLFATLLFALCWVCTLGAKAKAEPAPVTDIQDDDDDDSFELGGQSNLCATCRVHIAQVSLGKYLIVCWLYLVSKKKTKSFFFTFAVTPPVHKETARSLKTFFRKPSAHLGCCTECARMIVPNVSPCPVCGVTVQALIRTFT